MTEILDVVRALDERREGDRPAALATIVATSGSTYRRAGARLLVFDDGTSIGNISGGCLEGEVETLAREVIATGRPQLHRFDLTAEDEAVWGWGLGCNGTIDLLIEPSDHAARTAGTLRRALEADEPLVAVTVLESDLPAVEPGARLVLSADGSVEGTLGHGDADAGVIAAARDVRNAEESRTDEVSVGGERLRVFVEVLLPQPRLLVCGAGHDAIPVVRDAAALGWRVSVVDDRAAFLQPERFPGAAEFVHVESPEQAADSAGVSPWTSVVVMSHNYLRDIDYLRSFLGTEVVYIGMLGPRRRLERLLDDLVKDGVLPSDDDLAKIHGPAGLDIGADGPEEIAAAITAELLAVRHGRSGGYLRDRAEPIHDKPQAVISP
jgi:xanthine dehydrogenase accessory factor